METLWVRIAPPCHPCNTVFLITKSHWWNHRNSWCSMGEVSCRQAGCLWGFLLFGYQWYTTPTPSHPDVGLLHTPIIHPRFIASRPPGYHQSSDLIMTDVRHQYLPSRALSPWNASRISTFWGPPYPQPCSHGQLSPGPTDTYNAGRWLTHHPWIEVMKVSRNITVHAFDVPWKTPRIRQLLCHQNWAFQSCLSNTWN